MAQERVKVYLKSGAIIIAKHGIDALYDSIYDDWMSKSTYLIFDNCQIVTADVSAIKWDIEE